MRATFGAVLLVLGILVSSELSAFGQSEPSTTYTFNNLTSGFRTTPFGGYKADDFFLGAINTDPTYNVDVYYTLTSNSNSYQYMDLAGNCIGTGGVITLGATTITPFQNALVNMLNVYIVASTTEFQGSVTEYTTGNLAFYALSPNTFSVSTSTFESTMCDAFIDAWESLSVDVPWYYDAGSATLVSSYANTWQNNDFWNKGWHTTVTVHNGGASSTQYTLHYNPAENSGVFKKFDSANSCNLTSPTDHYNETVAAGNTYGPANLSTELGLDSTNDVNSQDGWLYITLNPFIGGTTPSSHIYPNSSGAAKGCDGTACINVPWTTMCH